MHCHTEARFEGLERGVTPSRINFHHHVIASAFVKQEFEIHFYFKGTLNDSIKPLVKTFGIGVILGHHSDCPSTCDVALMWPVDAKPG